MTTCCHDHGSFIVVVVVVVLGLFVQGCAYTSTTTSTPRIQ